MLQGAFRITVRNFFLLKSGGNAFEEVSAGICYFMGEFWVDVFFGGGVQRKNRSNNSTPKSTQQNSNQNFGSFAARIWP